MHSYSKISASLVVGLSSLIWACTSSKPLAVSENEEDFRSPAAANEPELCGGVEQWKDIHPYGLKIPNYADFPPQASLNDPQLSHAFYRDYYRAPPQTPAEAQSLIANLFTDDNQNPCRQKILSRFADSSRPAPRVYIFFTGLYPGLESQSNRKTDAAEVLKWMHERDPGALIFSMNWHCKAAQDEGYPWCDKNAKDISIPPTHPAIKNISRSLRVLGNKNISEEQIQSGLVGQQQSFTRALSSSVDTATHLVNVLLTAGVTQIRVAGWSMGANAASDFMLANFNAPPARAGFTWTKPGVCDDGSQTCTVAHLKSLKWVLSMGAPGWSHALRDVYNNFSSDGRTGRDAASRAL
jgi:hypothetical protein